MGLSTSTGENNMKQSIKNNIIGTLIVGVVIMAGPLLMAIICHVLEV